MGMSLVPPTIVEHNRVGFDAAVAALKQVAKQHDVRDLLVAVERTGRYHHAPARAFAAGGCEGCKRWRRLADCQSAWNLPTENRAASREPQGMPRTRDHCNSFI